MTRPRSQRCLAPRCRGPGVGRRCRLPGPVDHCATRGSCPGRRPCCPPTPWPADTRPAEVHGHAEPVHPSWVPGGSLPAAWFWALLGRPQRPPSSARAVEWEPRRHALEPHGARSGWSAPPTGSGGGWWRGCRRSSSRIPFRARRAAWHAGLALETRRRVHSREAHAAAFGALNAWACSMPRHCRNERACSAKMLSLVATSDGPTVGPTKRQPRSGRRTVARCLSPAPAASSAGRCGPQTAASREGGSVGFGDAVASQLQRLAAGVPS